MNRSKPDRARLSTPHRHLLLALVLIVAGWLPGAATSARGETERLVRAGILQMDGIGQFHNQAGESLFDVVLTYTADKENWELERVPIPFSNGSAALMVQHEIELLAALPHTAEQSQQVRLSKEAVFTTWAQVCLANGIEAQSLLDLKELQVGIVRDDYFAEEIQRLAAGLDISCYFIEFNSAKEMLGALSSGWIQAGVTDRLVVETEGHAYDIIPSSIYFAPLKYHFAAPRDISPAVLEAVDYHLKQLKDDPESAYHHFIEGVFHTHNSSRIPVLLKWILIIAAGVFLLLLAANSVLRRQVRVKTSALANNNARLEEELRQRSRAEAALSESEKQFRSLFASSIAGIAIHRLEYNAEGRACDYTITDINPAFSTHTGIAAEGVRGSLGSVLYRSQPPPFLKCFAEVAETGLPQRFETLFDPLGKHFNVSVFSPRQHHFVTVFEDISGRKQAEENLRRSEEKYRLLIDHASDAILIVQQNKIRYGNPSAYRIAGLTGQDLIDRDFSDFLLPDDDLKHRRSDQAAHTAMHPSGKRPFRVINQAGETLWVEMSMVDIEWENRAATLCFIRDITQTKRLEEKLLESQKLQAIGTLAGGIAHDFNNLLAAIMGFTELTLHSIPDDDPIRPNLNHVLSASERAKALIQRILAFSRQPKKDLKPIAVAPLVSEALQLLRASLPSTIAMETQIADDTGIDQPDRHEPLHQRCPCHGRTQRGVAHRSGSLPYRPRGGQGIRRPAAGPLRLPVGRRQRQGHGSQDSKKNLRSLLYNQESGGRHWFRAFDGAWDRQIARRHHSGLQRA